MAPWVGPLSYGRLTFRGVTYELPPNEGDHAVHGVVAGVPWDVEGVTEDSASLVRTLDGLWPFGGQVSQLVRIRPGEIELTIEVRATTSAMPVAAGWHPWFARGSGDVVVRVAADRHLVHEGPLPTGRVELVDGEIDLRGETSLGDRRIDVVFVDSSAPADLITSDAHLLIEADPESRVTVVYTPPEAVCVERWSAWPDAHRWQESGARTGLAIIEPGDVVRRWTRWTWRSPAGRP